ncbi:MAG: TIGR00159 family protein [Acidobacteria bacterium 13_1_40CM_56_16]|nr:MAG: TIGR00159 family protein [Acidobacteria bacterium 13_1_40CM_56_16]OLD70062.1 MAG: TIGR00159 family protein [Acidobacteria bacterium 13_1_40CM_2_56_11]
MLEFFSVPHLTWTAVLDIVVVAVIIYQLLVFIKGTRAVQMALGLALIVVFFYFSRWIALETVSWMVTNILPYFVFVIIVIFQHEIRRALVRFGQAPLFGGFSTINRNEFYDEIVLAVRTLTTNQTGALIVIERDIGLKTYIESGIALDATLSYDLLVSIFNPSVPLHDGAVIIQNRRIAAGACFLPLTVKPRLSKELGTRHRAAIGVTEETDAVAIVVSEETGAISFAHDGEIERYLDPDTLRQRLRNAFERKTLATVPRTIAEPAEHRLE